MAAEKQPWDKVERRIKQATIGITGLNVAARAASNGGTEVEQIFKHTGESTDRIVREGDFNNKPLKEIIGAILDAAQVNTNSSQKKTPVAPATLSRSREHRRQIELFEEQNAIQTADLTATGQSNKGMPTRIQIVDSLTIEILDRALRIHNKFGGEPLGLLVADNDRHAKKRAIDHHKVSGQKYDTYMYDPDNTDLWNGGRPWVKSKRWEYLITNGQEDIPNDPRIRGKNYPKTQAWVQKYAEEDLDVLSGADEYLTLQRYALSQGKRIDRRSFTVLNARSLTESSLVAVGRWYNARVSLSNDNPGNVYADLRLRSAERVPLKKLSL